MDWFLSTIIESSNAKTASELCGYIMQSLDLGDDYDAFTRCVLLSLSLSVESAINCTGSDDIYVIKRYLLNS
jgi:hypothetical protein